MKMNSIKYTLCGILTVCSLLMVTFALAGEVRISNVRGTQFTVSWTTDQPCKGEVMYFKDGLAEEITYDDRGKDYVGTTHFVTIKHLKPNTTYYFKTVSSGDIIDDNDGSSYLVNTGPALIPSGSLQPAGRIYEEDGKTPANGAIVYITVEGGMGKSAPVATLVDENGYWYVELVNSRTADLQGLFAVTGDDVLGIEVDGGLMGAVALITSATDNEGGTNLRRPIILE